MEILKTCGTCRNYGELSFDNSGGWAFCNSEQSENFMQPMPMEKSCCQWESVSEAMLAYRNIMAVYAAAFYKANFEMQAKTWFKSLSEHTSGENRWVMQRALNLVWDEKDHDLTEMRNLLFPEGKPTLENFAATIQNFVKSNE